MQRVLAFAAILTLAAPAWAGSFELKDLEALEKQESWQEILNHLDDIPPSKRNDVWQRVAEKAGAGVLNAIDPSKEGDRGRWGPPPLPHAVQLADAILKQYPTLKKSKVFMSARADSGLKGFKVTFSNSSHNAGDDPWRDQLKAFAASDPSTPDLQLRAGKLVTSRLVAYVAIPFFKAAINGTPGAGICKDADVKKALVSALSDSQWTEDAKAMTTTCFADVKGDLEKELGKEPDKIEKLKTNACPIFAAKKAAVAACK
jgi:hypothetical protein